MAQAILYDPFGVQIDLKPVAAPPRFTVLPEGVERSVNDRYRDSMSDMRPQRLASILDAADAGDPHQWILLCEEILEKEPKFKSVLNTRALAVKGLYWNVEPAELDDDAQEADRVLADKMARFVARALKMSNFDDLVANLLTAVGKPYAISWMDWLEDRNGKAVPYFKTITPTHLRWAFTKDEIRLFDPATMKLTDGDFGQPLKPFTTVRALYNPDGDHPTRGGLLRTLAWFYCFKLQTLKALLAWCDRYGMPMRILRLDDEHFKDSEFRGLLREAIKTLGTDASAVISKSAELEIVEAAKSGDSPFMAVIDYCDKAAAQLVLGHELSSQSSPGPGQLGITASLEVRQDIMEGDCHWLSAIVERDVHRPLIGFNFGWDKMHLVPSLYFDCEPAEDLAAAANTVEIVGRALPGLAFSKQQMRDTFGYNEPLDDDDILMPRAASSSFGEFGQLVPSEEPLAEESVPKQVQSVNRVFARKRGPSKYRPKRQAKVDRLAKRSLIKSEAVLSGWEKQLRKLLRAAVADGKGPLEVRREIVKAYPELDSSDLQETIRKGMQLARLFGRNSE